MTPAERIAQMRQQMNDHKAEKKRTKEETERRERLVSEAARALANDLWHLNGLSCVVANQGNTRFGRPLLKGQISVSYPNGSVVLCADTNQSIYPLMTVEAVYDKPSGLAVYIHDDAQVSMDQAMDLFVAAAERVFVLDPDEMVEEAANKATAAARDKVSVNADSNHEAPVEEEIPW